MTAINGQKIKRSDTGARVRYSCLRGVVYKGGDALWLRDRGKRQRVFGGRRRHSHTCAPRGKYSFLEIIDDRPTFITADGPWDCRSANPSQLPAFEEIAGQYRRDPEDALSSRSEKADDAIVRYASNYAPRRH